MRSPPDPGISQFGLLHVSSGTTRPVNKLWETHEIARVYNYQKHVTVELFLLPPQNKRAQRAHANKDKKIAASCQRATMKFVKLRNHGVTF